MERKVYSEGELTPEQIEKLAFVTDEMLREGEAAFIKHVEDRQERVKKVMSQLKLKFGLSNDDFKKLPEKQQQELIKEIHREINSSQPDKRKS